jgi:hypothetical protein
MERWEQLKAHLPDIKDFIMTKMPKIINGLIKFVKWMGGQFKDFIDWLASEEGQKKMKEWIDNIKGFFTGLIEKWENFKKNWAVVKAWCEGFWEGLKEGWNNVQEFFTTIFTAIIVSWNWICDKAVAGWNKVKGWWKACGEWLTGIGNSIAEWWNNLGRRWRLFKWRVKKAFIGAWDYVTSIPDRISNAFSNAWESTKKFFTETFDSWGKSISDSWNSVKKFFSDGWNSIVNTISGWGTGIANTISGLWTSIKESVSETVDKVSDWFVEKVRAIPVIGEKLFPKNAPAPPPPQRTAYTKEEALMAIEKAKAKGGVLYGMNTANRYMNDVLSGKIKPSEIVIDKEGRFVRRLPKKNPTTEIKNDNLEQFAETVSEANAQPDESAKPLAKKAGETGKQKVEPESKPVETPKQKKPTPSVVSKINTGIKSNEPVDTPNEKPSAQANANAAQGSLSAGSNESNNEKSIVTKGEPSATPAPTPKPAESAPSGQIKPADVQITVANVSGTNKNGENELKSSVQGEGSASQETTTITTEGNQINITENNATDITTIDGRSASAVNAPSIANLGMSTNVINETLKSLNMESYAQFFKDSGSTPISYINTVIEHVNQARSSVGAQPLTLNIKPNDDAKKRDETMIALFEKLNRMFVSGLTLRTNDKDQAVLTFTQDVNGTHEVTKQELTKIG